MMFLLFCIEISSLFTFKTLAKTYYHSLIGNSKSQIENSFRQFEKVFI